MIWGTVTWVASAAKFLHPTLMLLPAVDYGCQASIQPVPVRPRGKLLAQDLLGRTEAECHRQSYADP